MLWVSARGIPFLFYPFPSHTLFLISPSSSSSVLSLPCCSILPHHLFFSFFLLPLFPSFLRFICSFFPLNPFLFSPIPAIPSRLVSGFLFFLSPLFPFFLLFHSLIFRPLFLSIEPLSFSLSPLFHLFSPSLFFFLLSHSLLSFIPFLLLPLRRFLSLYHLCFILFLLLRILSYPSRSL